MTLKERLRKLEAFHRQHACPAHPTSRLVCHMCDVVVAPEPTEREWEEFDALFERLGLRAERYPRYAPCPRCGTARLCDRCNAAAEAGMDDAVLSEAEQARLDDLLGRVRWR
jgi:hypothetical protein